jgi:hypothetical protein
LPAINSRHKQGVQKFVGGSDERVTFHVFLPRLLADQRDFGARRAFPENRLTRMLPEAAILAIPCFFRKALCPLGLETKIPLCVLQYVLGANELEFDKHKKSAQTIYGE